jgi:hypothetical protein
MPTNGGTADGEKRKKYMKKKGAPAELGANQFRDCGTASTALGTGSLGMKTIMIEGVFFRKICGGLRPAGTCFGRRSPVE